MHLRTFLPDCIHFYSLLKGRFVFVNPICSKSIWNRWSLCKLIQRGSDFSQTSQLECWAYARFRHSKALSFSFIEAYTNPIPYGVTYLKEESDFIFARMILALSFRPEIP